MEKIMKEYTQLLNHLDKRNYDIIKLPDSMLLPFLEENGFNAVYNYITAKNSQNLDVIDSWKLTELNNIWIEFKEQVESEVAEIIQTHHYEDMEVTKEEKKLLYQVKMGLISQEEFKNEMDRQRQAIIEDYKKKL